LLQLINKFGRFVRIYYICLILNTNVLSTMLANYLLLNFFLIIQSLIVVMLLVVVLFFGVILFLGVRKSYLLKKENDKLEQMNTSIEEDEEYKDFTDGHMYGGN